MNRKTNHSNILVSVATGTLLTLSFSTVLHAHGGPMGGASSHNRMTMAPHDIGISHGRSGQSAGSEIVGFGEYDPATPQGAHEAEPGLAPRSIAGVANFEVGFGETDPAGIAKTDVDAPADHDMVPLVAGGAERMNRENGMDAACLRQAADHRN